MSETPVFPSPDEPFVEVVNLPQPDVTVDQTPYADEDA